MTNKGKNDTKSTSPKSEIVVAPKMNLVIKQKERILIRNLTDDQLNKAKLIAKEEAKKAGILINVVSK